MARVFKRADAWWIDYFFEGKRHRQKIGAKRKAEGALANVRTKIASGDFVAPGLRVPTSEAADILTFRTFTEDEFIPWSEMQHSASHHERIKFALSKHVYPVFGDMPVDQITVKQIEDYKSARRRGEGSVGQACIRGDSEPRIVRPESHPEEGRGVGQVGLKSCRRG